MLEILCYKIKRQLFSELLNVPVAVQVASKMSLRLLAPAKPVYMPSMAISSRQKM